MPDQQTDKTLTFSGSEQQVLAVDSEGQAWYHLPLEMLHAPAVSTVQVSLLADTLLSDRHGWPRFEGVFQLLVA